QRPAARKQRSGVASLRALRAETLDDLLPDTTAECFAALIARGEMNAAVDARNARLVRSRIERIEMPHVVPDRDRRAVLERDVSNQRGQHGCRRGRLRRVARWVLGKGRRWNKWLPGRIDETPNVRARTNQIVL